MALNPNVNEKISLEQNKLIYDEYMDKGYAQALTKHVLHILMDAYFVVEKIGFEKSKLIRNNPKHPLIMISNHSGMSFPWDGIVFMSYTLREENYEINRVPRPIVAPVLSRTKLMNPFMIHHLWKKCGGVDATFLNFETMMHYPSSHVMVFPEGVMGIGKGFNHKYKLQRLATSFVRMSLKYNTDVVPFVTINGEYLNPYSYSCNWINKIVKKIGLPFLPIGFHTPLLLFLPWMFYFAMPAKLIFVKCRRIRPSDFVHKPYEALSQQDIEIVRDQIAKCMQEDLDANVLKYGQQPYHWKAFFKAVKKNFKYFPFMFPIAWPLIFAEFERQWERYQKTGKAIKLHFGVFAPLLYMVRNPITIFYYIPILGWVPLLLKGYSRYRKK